MRTLPCGCVRGLIYTRWCNEHYQTIIDERYGDLTGDARRGAPVAPLSSMETQREKARTEARAKGRRGGGHAADANPGKAPD